MLLAVDVGNTQTVLGLYDGDRLTEQRRLATEASRTGDELGALLGEMLDLGFGRRDLPLLDRACARPRVRALRRALGAGADPRRRARARRPGFRCATTTRVRSGRTAW